MSNCATWPERKYVLVPVFQQTTLRMLQLAQQYQAAAGELKQDSPHYELYPSPARNMREQAGSIARTLLRAQCTVLTQLVSVPWPETEPLHSIFRTLYMSCEVPTAALQLLAAACEGLQQVYKDMARRHQLMKRKKKQQSGQQVALNPLLLKLTVPADHVNLGVPLGWEEGAVKALGFRDWDSSKISPPAYVCQLLGKVIFHVSGHVSGRCDRPPSWEQAAEAISGYGGGKVQVMSAGGAEAAAGGGTAAAGDRTRGTSALSAAALTEYGGAGG